MTPYQYSTLSPDPHQREIRLMQLVSATDCDSGTEIFHFILFKASLNDPPTYRALSYAWGDLQNTRTVKVDDRDFQISNNLYFALRHLCTQQDNCTLWVDAVCINQDDNEEKSYQVGLMRDIYAQAQLVIAWLGPADDDSEVAMDCLRKLGHEAICLGLQDSLLHSEMKSKEQFEAHSAKLARLSDSSQAEQEIPGPLMTFRNDILSLNMTGGGNIPIPEVAIVALLNRSWFQRAWVLQEIVVAKSAFFVCGEEWISIDTFRAAYVLLFLLKDRASLYREASLFEDCVGMPTSGFVRLSKVVRKFIDYAHRFFTIRTIRRCGGVGLYFLLERTSPLAKPYYLECKDPRDRVYALLGLVSEDFNPRIRPDYNKPCNLVYTEVAEALLKVNGPQLLSMPLFCRVRQGLPTWVPDWSMKRKCDSSLLGRFSNNGRPLFSASKSTEFVHQVTNDQKGTAKLIVSGIHVDTVMEVMSTNVTDSFVDLYTEGVGDIDERRRAASNFLKSLDRFSEMAKMYPSALDREEAAWRTTIADTFLVTDTISESTSHVASYWTRVDGDHRRADTTRAAYRAYLCGACTTEQQFHYHYNTAISHKLLAEDGPFGLTGKSFRSHFENCRHREENLANLVNEMAETCSAFFNLLLHDARGMHDEKTSAAIESNAQTARDAVQAGKETLYGWLKGYIQTTEFENYSMNMLKGMVYECIQYATESANILNGRRIFVTSNGYLGLGPAEVEPDDVVAVILGAKIPFVLRKAQEQTFMLVGEVYVHGIMDGEIVDDSKVIDIEIV